jgi:ketosteroid isomerase-like protein
MEQLVMSRIAAFLALVALAVPALADFEQEVRCREIGFSKSVETQDHELFTSFIDPDARFIGGKVDRGRENIAEAWKVFFGADSPSIKWRPQFIEVLESANLALSRGPYRIVSRDEQGETVEAWGTFNSVWRLTADGEWLVVFDAGSAPDETPTDEQRELIESDAGCD